MTNHFARIDFSKNSEDYRRTAISPGYPLLDRTNANGRIVAKWLRHFSAEPECHGGIVDWFVRSDDGARLEQLECSPATSQDLKGPLRHELKTLQDRLDQVNPSSRTEKAVYQAVSESLRDALSRRDQAAPMCGFFKYRDLSGKWRLVWAWGYQPADQDESPPAICVNHECRCLFLLRPERQRTCPVCKTKIPAPPSVWKRAVATILMLLLLSAGAYGLYWYLQPRAVLTGAVTWVGDHQPIGNAEICIVDTEFAARTGPTGQFRLERLPEGPVSIEVSAKGFESQQIDQELVAGEEASIRVAMVGNTVLEGTVVNAVSDVPVSGARLQIAGTDFHVETDETGRFRFDTLRGGSVELTVSAEGFPDRQLEPELKVGDENEIKVTLTGQAVLVGQVLDAANEAPIAGALIKIPKTGQSAQSNEEGWFVLKQLPAGTATIEVTADRFAAERVDKLLAPNSERSIQVKLHGAANLTGDVRTAVGDTPISSAEIRIDGMRLSAHTDENGHFSLPGVRAGTTAIIVSAPGFQPKRLDKMLTSGHDTEVHVVLEGAAKLTGIVLDSATEQPVPEADVSIPGKRQKTRTDPKGKFTIDGLPSGAATIRIQAVGFLEQESKQELKANAETPIQIQLKGDASLTGTVVDGTTQEPIVAAQIHFVDTKLSTQTDDGGRFQIPHLRSGTAQIEASAKGYPSQVVDIKLPPKKTTTVEVTLTGDATLSGHVVAVRVKKTAVANATIRVAGSKRKVETGKDGAFQFENLPSGPTKIVVAAQGYRSQTIEQNLPANKQTDVEVVLGGDAVLSGKVYDKTTGQNIADATIAIDGTSLTTQTNHSGHFELKDVFGGPATIHVTAAGYPSQTIEQDFPSGQITMVDIGLTGMAVFTGVVHSEDGHPVPNATIRLAGTKHSCQTDADGSFRLENCRAGAAKFEVQAKDFASSTLEANLEPDKPTAAGKIELASAISVTGTIVNAINEKPIANVSATIEGTSIQATSDAQGAFQLDSVPAGPIQIHFVADGYYPESHSLNTLTNPRRIHVVLSPMLEAGQMRLVLTWNNTVPDLDIHLYGPLPDGGKFHVSHKKREVANVALDVDNRKGHGPETITISKAVPGHYEIVVHAYQDPKDAQQTGISIDRAQARIKLYRSGVKEAQQFLASTDPKVARHTVWHVGTIDVDSTGNVKITPYHRFNYDDDLPR